ncbi:MAG: hypothetical protein MJB57_13925 [Gemmatimonadetes bacterium]|nr:hypothetical protein [Gemmatimonadota bacterium]
MSHLTAEQIERFADARFGLAPAGASAAHLASCAECREEVEEMRGLVSRLARLSSTAPSARFADAVLARVELPGSNLERELAALRRTSPAPGFATDVLTRVRLPVPWPQRVGRFARRRKLAVATACAGTVSIMGAACLWLFGSQGVAPAQVARFVLGGVRALAVDGAVALGRLGYQLGLVDAGGSISNQISLITALGGLGLAGVLGLSSLWAMARLSRPRPQPVVLVEAA